MAKQIGEDTKVTLDLKTIGIAGAGLAALIGMYFTLQADIALAKELPEPQPPEISRMEFDMKDQLVRQSTEKFSWHRIASLFVENSNKLSASYTS